MKSDENQQQRKLFTEPYINLFLCIAAELARKLCLTSTRRQLEVSQGRNQLIFLG